MSVVNLINILAYYLADGCMRGGLAPVASSISVVLVARLMLNLHEALDIGIYMSSYHTAHLEQLPQMETHMSFNRPRSVTVATQC
ncbi:hypothetical protein AAF712_007489 [Marasmius tenuissimus]|uniref:Uncharacterized protein n=1 Tax=Marasmius tenuissimus TaxID=585030 RepID=A0ABR2ZVT6_9AGAR